MSIIYCDACDSHFDSDFQVECESCDETHEETTPTWFRGDPVRAVPTHEELSAAAQASYDAFEAYHAAYKAGQDVTDLWAEYMAAIDHAADVSNQRFVAKLKEAGICSL